MDFRVILRNVNYNLSGSPVHETIHDATHDAIHDSSISTRQKQLLDFCVQARSRDEMQTYIGISNRSHFSKFYLKPLLVSGALHMTLPDKPKSKNQKYIAASAK